MLSLAVLNSSFNLRNVFRTMFSSFHVATVNILGVVEKTNGITNVHTYFVFYSIDATYLEMT